MMPSSTDVFFVAPFALDGEFLGIGSLEVSGFSPKWLAICESILRQHGPLFRISMGQMLTYLEIELTSANGVGLSTFYAKGEAVISAAYLSGRDAEAERTVSRMFVDSLRSIPIIQQAKGSERPFESVFMIPERPLHVVVVWTNPNVSPEDFQLLQELSSHFAAAFLFCEKD